MVVTAGFGETVDKTPQHSLPDVVFALIPEFYPFFITVLRRCDLRGPEFFALSVLRSSEERVDRRPARLLAQLVEVIEGALASRRGKIASPMGRERHWGYEVIDDLFQRGLVSKRDLKDRERDELFPNVPGGKDKAILLTAEGEQLLAAFNGHVNELYNELISSAGVPGRIISFMARVSSPTMGPQLKRVVRDKARAAWKQIADRSSPPTQDAEPPA